MRAAYIEETGQPESIKVGELPRPERRDRDRCSSGSERWPSTRSTCISGRALVAMPMPFPYVIACDLAGTVEKVGPECTRFKVGDRVWGSNQGLLGRQGVAAEFAAVDEDWLYPTPAILPTTEAAAMAPGRASRPTWGSSSTASSRPAKRCTCPGGAAASARWSCRWPRRSARAWPPSAGSPRSVELCRTLGRGPGPQLQDRRHSRPAPRVRPRRGRRLVRDPARAESRSDRPAAPQAGADDPHGRPDGQAGSAARGFLSSQLHAPRLRHVQRHAR